MGIAIFDREMRYLAASSRFLTDQGLPGETPLVGNLHYEAFPEIPDRWRALHRQVIDEGVELSHEADPFVGRDGRAQWIRWSMAPWRSEAGEISGLVLYTEVVTRAVEARMALEAAEARYHAIFDQAALGVARIALGGAILEVNDGFCAIADCNRDTLTGALLQDLVDENDRIAYAGQWAMVITGEAPSWSNALRLVGASGRPTWVNLTLSIVRVDDNAEYLLALVQDVSADKEKEADQVRHQAQLRLMINELNHRVKNTLAMVQSMAAQTLRNEPDSQAAYKKFEARLVSLAEAHDILTRERWHGAALNEVMGRALAPFISGRGGKVLTHGDPVWLPPSAALSLGMIFHELATNSIKYGSLSRPEGRVDLAWAVGAEGADLEITWQESGGPIVKPPTRRGFGSRLIEWGLAGEPRSEASLTYAPSGLVCRLRLGLDPHPGGPAEMFAET